METTEVSIYSKIKKMIWEHKRWIVASVLIIIFVIIAENVFQKELFVLDFTIYDFLIAHRNNLLTGLFIVITQFGGAIVLIGATVLCIIFAKKEKHKIIIPINLLLIALLNIGLKSFFERPRPNQLRIIEETGFSFPSGHSMASMAFYGYLIYLAFTCVKNKKLRNTLCIILGFLIFLIGFSRIYLGVHYASDVIAGFCFSMAYLIFMISIGIYK